MDEEYQNTVNQTSSSNPWADFEPIDTPRSIILITNEPFLGPRLHLQAVHNHSQGLVALLDR